MCQRGRFPREVILQKSLQVYVYQTLFGLPIQCDIDIHLTCQIKAMLVSVMVKHESPV